MPTIAQQMRGLVILEDVPVDRDGIAGVVCLVKGEEKFVCQEPKPGGTPGQICLSKMRNDGRNIGSHVSKMHKEGSKYRVKQDKNDAFRCRVCGEIKKGFNPYLGHMRQYHNHKGSEDPLLEDKVKAKK